MLLGKMVTQFGCLSRSFPALLYDSYFVPTESVVQGLETAVRYAKPAENNIVYALENSVASTSAILLHYLPQNDAHPIMV
jgi:hypothetical protein